MLSRKLSIVREHGSLRTSKFQVNCLAMWSLSVHNEKQFKIILESLVQFNRYKIDIIEHPLVISQFDFISVVQIH